MKDFFHKEIKSHVEQNVLSKGVFGKTSSTATIPLQATLLMSSSSPKTAKSFDIYQALNDAPDGGSITIPTGEYLLSKPLEISKNVNIAGETGDPADVTLVSEHGAAVVIRASFARICAVKFSNQNADEVESSTNLVRSSVVVVTSGQSELVNCVITGKGDGLAVSGSQSAPVLRYCKIQNCTCGGVWILDRGRALLYRCSVSQCGHAALAVCGQSAVKAIKTEIHHGYNIGAYIYQNSFGRFRECSFHHNALTGFELKNNSDCVCESCQMSFNQEHGVCVWDDCAGRFEHCDIFENMSIQFLSINSNPQIIDSQIHESPGIGVMFHNNSGGQMDSCEVCNTADAAVVVSDGSEPTITDSVFHHARQSGVMSILNAQGRFKNCEICLCKAGGVFIADNASPTFIDCYIHHNKECGVQVLNQGEGKFYNNSFFDNSGNNWLIEKTAGEVLREENSPNW